MTAQESLKRNEKSQWLKVWQVDDTWFYVESEDGKIAYKCCISDQGIAATAETFATRSKNDPQFKCKHILAVMNSIPEMRFWKHIFWTKGNRSWMKASSRRLMTRISFFTEDCLMLPIRRISAWSMSISFNFPQMRISKQLFVRQSFRRIDERILDIGMLIR